MIGGGFEGDMVFPDGFDPHTSPQQKGVAIAGPRAWPSGVVPYDLSYISCKFIFSQLEEHFYLEKSISLRLFSFVSSIYDQRCHE